MKLKHIWKIKPWAIKCPASKRELKWNLFKSSTQTSNTMSLSTPWWQKHWYFLPDKIQS